MWVQELYIDEFDGGGDLALQGLSARLNVVRVPSHAAEACLAQFVPTLLYGSPHRGADLRAGSLVAMQQSETGAWETLELCRLPLEVDTGLSELQILTERGVAVDEERLLETLEAIDGPVYRAVFTDSLPVAERLANWRAADWIVPLLRRTESAAESAETKSPVTRQSVSAECRQTNTRRDALVRWSSLGAQMRLSDVEATQRSAADERSTRDLEAIRSAYFSAKQESTTQRNRILELSDQLQQQEQELTLLESAADAQICWSQLEILEARLASPPPRAVAATDMRQLKRLRHQIGEARERLRGARAQHQELAEQLKQADTIARRYKQLEAILDTWPACRDRQRRCNELRRQLTQRPRALESAPRELLDRPARDAFVEIRRLAQSLRAARHDVERNRQGLDQATGTSPPVDAADVLPLPDSQIESLRRQIRQLREETRRMLQRQLLSRRALLGIGLLFSTGVTILLSAFLLNLEGAELAIGSMGLTCMLAAALLKSSFERTPTYELRRQRLRITALFTELQRVRSLPEPVSDLEQGREPKPGGHASTGPQSASDDVSRIERTEAWAYSAATARLSECERAWSDLLERLEIDEGSSPVAVVRQLRRRTAQTLRTREQALRSAWRHELDQQQMLVDQWCEHAAEWLQANTSSDSFPTAGQDIRGDLDDSQRPAVEAWLPRLQAEKHRLESQLHATEFTHPAQAEILCESELTRLKRQRREILRRNGARHISELEQRLKEQSRRQAWMRDQQRLKHELDSRLPLESAQGQRVRTWFESGHDLDLERERQQESLTALRNQLNDAQQAWAQQQTILAQVAERPWAGAARTATARHGGTKSGHQDALAFDLAGAVLASLGEAELTEADSTAAESTEGPPPPTRLGQPHLLQWASRYLQLLWVDDGCEIGWDDPGMGPYIVHGEEAATSFADLLPEQQHALVLALQMGLVRCLTQRIGHLPLILTDRSFAVDEGTLTQLTGLLHELSQIGQQVLVVTTHAAISEQFRRWDIPTLIVMRQVHTGAFSV